MSFSISRWLLEQNIFNDYKIELSSNWLQNLSKVNIFIGQNNTGKSRFLRKLFFDSNTFFLPPDISSLINDIYFELGKNDLIKSIDFGKLVDGIVFKINEKYKEHYSSNFDRLARELPHNRIDPNFNTVIKERNQKYLSAYEAILSVNKTYIPVLRGLRKIGGDPNGYDNRIINDHFADFAGLGKSRKLEIYTGLKFYEIMHSLHNGSNDEQQLKREFEDFINSKFFENRGVFITPREGKDVVFINFKNENQFPIYEVGDGIQQLIIMLFPIFEYKYKNEMLLLFIEEPELYLHPALQRKFLEILSSSEFNNVQTFITTHSNHFLDMSLDFKEISIYKFSRKHEGEANERTIFLIKNTSNEDRHLLEILGVKNSSVMLSNCTIWVEGITDRMYMRRYLELYQKVNGKKIFEEDKHYSFVEYSGKNITHWSFLDEESGMNPVNLCGNLFLIADKDDGNLTRHEKLTKTLKERFYPLQCREVENLLKPDILYKVVEDYEGGAENMTGLEAIKYDDYKNEYLGSYIEDEMLKDKSKTNRKNKTNPYSIDSGTIKDKIAFAQKAIKHINSLSDMSDEAIILCEKIYHFIEQNNQ